MFNYSPKGQDFHYRKCFTDAPALHEKKPSFHQWPPLRYPFSMFFLVQRPNCHHSLHFLLPMTTPTPPFPAISLVAIHHNSSIFLVFVHCQRLPKEVTFAYKNLPLTNTIVEIKLMRNRNNITIEHLSPPCRSESSHFRLSLSNSCWCQEGLKATSEKSNKGRIFIQDE